MSTQTGKFNIKALYDFGEKKVIPASDLVKVAGKLIFTKSDVENVTDPLMKLMRKVFFEEQIRYDYLKSKLKEYYRDELRWPDKKVKHQITNMDKILYKNTLSFTKFSQYMAAVDFRVKYMSCTIIKDEEYQTFSGANGEISK